MHVHEIIAFAVNKNSLKFFGINVDGGISYKELFYLCFRYNKRKYVEIQEARKKGDGPYKRMRRLKKKKKIN